MKIVFLVLFAAASIAHLYFSWKDDKRGRAVTKPFLLLFLALYYVFSVDKISLVLLFALLTSWLGDVLLIPKGHKWFSAGGVSFMVSHFLFIAVYIERISFAEVLWLPVIVAALVYCIVAAKIISMGVEDDTPAYARRHVYISAGKQRNERLCTDAAVIDRHSWCGHCLYRRGAVFRLGLQPVSRPLL